MGFYGEAWGVPPIPSHFPVRAFPNHSPRRINLKTHPVRTSIRFLPLPHVKIRSLLYIDGKDGIAHAVGDAQAQCFFLLGKTNLSQRYSCPVHFLPYFRSAKLYLDSKTPDAIEKASDYINRLENIVLPFIRSAKHPATRASKYRGRSQ